MYLLSPAQHFTRFREKNNAWAILFFFSFVHLSKGRDICLYLVKLKGYLGVLKYCC